MICHEDIVGELLLKLPDTLRRDDSTSAPIMHFHINSQLNMEMHLEGQMRRLRLDHGFKQNYVSTARKI
jgi:hypothetical protein